MNRSPAEEPVRICYLIGSLMRCGTAIHLLAVLRNLDRRRFTPWVVGLAENGEIADDIAALGIEVHQLDLHSIYEPRTMRSLARLASRIRRTRTAIVQSYLFFDNVVGVVAGRAGGARAIITGRRTVDDWESPRHRRIYSLTNPFVDRIVAVSDEVAASVRRLERVDPRKIRLIRNSQSRATLQARSDASEDVALAALKERTRGGFVFGTVGNVRPIKGHDLLVRAFALIRARHPEAHLVIVGSGPFLGEVRRLAEDLGVAAAVHLEGRRANIFGYLESFDAFVLPSRAEGMSNALLEALLLEKPAISTRFGLPVAADGTEVVLGADPENTAELAGAMERVLVDGDLRARLSRAARAYVEAVMDETGMVRAYEALYEELL